MSLIKKLLFEFERVSMASLNMLQGLFGITSFSLCSLDFRAHNKVNRFLFLGEFCYFLEILFGSAFEKSSCTKVVELGILNLFYIQSFFEYSFL
jgi:hypothetical protein